ncbi:hypothetical protein [Tritonibacter horizontis]|uniref:DUF4440 domain-containing protein n=1 Tax=Tritonibacter horizontis TaxID=1768241 RepID=A0A132C212_9RHOB|nr:hypothetical protein [Tritonibacter horizontis]KUP94695.1 hypothetical protein TRIHO_06210 [Tritonibacter horizontis]
MNGSGARVTATTLAHAAHQTGTLSPLEQFKLWDLEHHFWTAVGDTARETTATNAVMIFPYPPGILQGDQIWSYLRERTVWGTAIMSERRVTRYRDIAVLTYRVVAEKAASPAFKALCATTYLCDDDRWLRICHHQTLVS